VHTNILESIIKTEKQLYRRRFIICLFRSLTKLSLKHPTIFIDRHQSRTNIDSENEFLLQLLLTPQTLSSPESNTMRYIDSSTNDFHWKRDENGLNGNQSFFIDLFNELNEKEQQLVKNWDDGVDE